MAVSGETQVYLIWHLQRDITELVDYTSEHPMSRKQDDRRRRQTRPQLKGKLCDPFEMNII
jgi:hypothetical protein